jgi:hypothetical protein
VPSRFHISALGSAIDIELTGFSEADVAIVRGAWSRTLVESPTLPVTTISIQPPGIEGLTTRVTLAAIEAAKDDLLMLHAGAVADATGATIAYVGPSGRGKTTASIALGARFGYVSDETVGIRNDLSVLAYAKPLSIVGTTRHKKQASPDALGLLTPPDSLHLHRIVLLDRQSDGPDRPTVDTVGLADAIAELVPQTSYLSALGGGGLQRVAAAAAGGLLRVTYRESETLAPVFAELFTRPAEPAETWRTVPPVAGDGGLRRAPFVDAITDGRRIIVLHDETVRVIDGIGSTVWLAAVGTTLDEVTGIVVQRHGEPPVGTPREHVDTAVAELLDAGVLSPLP